ncbi:MAG: hypothetical protein KDA84_18655 [Planctomycetaceae bacterium]|nr:hypothetical protein [Planctomycetaceae bacterium]
MNEQLLETDENLLNLTVHTAGGEAKTLEAPADMLGSDFVADLITMLQQPTYNSDNQLINWRVDNKETGLTLVPDKTLGENNVQDGHHLTLTRDAIPG